MTVNGQPAGLGTKALGSDQIRLDGRLVRQASPNRTALYLCHRSPGESLLQPTDGEDRAGFIDRLPARAGKRYVAISPMPRIDGGLELLGSDTQLVEQLQRRVRRLPMAFSVRVRGELAADQVDRILGGEIDSGARLQLSACEPGGGEGANRWYQVETTGANGRELRSLFERQGADVSRILRVGFGSLLLDRALPRGHFRALDESEVASLTGSPESPGSDAAH